MVILQEEVVPLAEVDIRLVLVNHRLRGVAEVVYVRVRISMRVPEPDIVQAVVRHVMVNIQAVTVLMGIIGLVVLVNHIITHVRVGIVRVVVMGIGEHLLRNAVAEQHLEHVMIVRVIVRLIPVARDVILI